MAVGSFSDGRGDGKRRAASDRALYAVFRMPDVRNGDTPTRTVQKLHERYCRAGRRALQDDYERLRRSA
jgi:hypothetical protein